MAWNVENLLTAVTMGRSLIETAAVVMNPTAEIEEAAQERDVAA